MERHASVWPTGLAALDNILGGGLLKGALVVVLGVPGSGKTTLAGHLGFAAARANQKVLILTALSEPTNKLIAHMRTFEFFDEDLLVDRIQVLSLQQALPKGLKATGDEIMSMVRQFGAQLIILDGFRGMRETENELDMMMGRQFLYRLGTTLSALGATTIVTSEADPRDPAFFPEMTTADVILGLHFSAQGIRHQRGIEAIKVRGAAPLPGIHGFAIDHTGIQVTPRFEAVVAATVPGRQAFQPGAQNGGHTEQYPTSLTREREPFGMQGLDTLLGGGVLRGSQTLLAGPAGSGKTLMALAFAHAGVNLGEPVVFASLGATREDLRFLAQPYALSAELEAAWEPGGLLTLLDSPAIAVDADVVARTLFEQIDRLQAKRLVIDGVEALEEALLRGSDPARHAAYFTSWRTALRNRGVTTLFTREMVGTEIVWPGPSRSMGDTVILLRHEPELALTLYAQRFTFADRHWHEVDLRAPAGPHVILPEAAQP